MESELRLISIPIMNMVPTKFVYYKSVALFYQWFFLVKN